MPLCEPFTLYLEAPTRGVQSYVAGPGAQLVLQNLNLANTSLKLEEGHLVLQSAQGGTVLVLEFATSSQPPCGVTLLTPEGDELRGKDIVRVVRGF